MSPLLSPEEFLREVEAIRDENTWTLPNGRPEPYPADTHPQTDGLMEDTLEALGYGAGVAIIRDLERWYS